jgi:DNA-binding transcriptional MerR regulator
MQIGIVAKKIGLSVDAIRFYERNALLPRPSRTQGGFRRYAQSDVETLAFIRRVQGLGFKLSEIRGLLNLRGNRLHPRRRGNLSYQRMHSLLMACLAPIQ